MNDFHESDCQSTLKELDRFLDDELTTQTRSAIHHHLEGCHDCYGAFDFNAELKEVVRAKCNSDEMPADLLSRIERCFDTDLDGDGVIG